MNNWKKIWNKNERVEKIILEMLIKADGFDSPTGNFEVGDWLKYTKSLYDKLEMQRDDTIYDVGCGSGAFIYPLYLQNHRVGGLDYSSVLIELAGTVMRDGDFSAMEALEIDIEQKYDIVLSHSVFFYFKDLEYARKVILKMLQKATKKIAIFDINDRSKQDVYHKTRTKTMSKEEYEEKYRGLEHLFYSKDFFRKIAKENNLTIEIWDQNFEKYNNSQFRFNVIMEKKS